MFNSFYLEFTYPTYKILIIHLPYLSLLGRPLVLRDVGLVHDELALPDTSKGQVPEIAVNAVLKACANERHFLVVRHVRPQPASNTMYK